MVTLRFSLPLCDKVMARKTDDMSVEDQGFRFLQGCQEEDAEK